MLNIYFEQSRNLYLKPNEKSKKITTKLLNEFKLNVVSATTIESKEGVIIHYLSEMTRIINIFLDEFDLEETTEDNLLIETLHRLFIEVEKYTYFFGLDINKLSELTGFDMNLVPRIGFTLVKDNSTIEESYLDLDFSEGQQKIIFLHELGVIDFLRQEYDNPSNSKIGEILKPVTNLNPDTIRKYLERITKDEMPKHSKSAVSNIINQLKINRKKTL